LVTFYLGFQLARRYQESVLLNQEWSDRLGRYTDLQRLAAALNRPGNDVFEYHDLTGEEARFTVALAAWNRGITQAEMDVANNVTPAEGRPIIKALQEARQATGAMIRSISQIFTLFHRGNEADAGRHMALMNREYDALNRETADISLIVRDILGTHFKDQSSDVAFLARCEYLVATLILAIAVSVTWYGIRLSQHMDASSQILENSHSALRESEGRFRTLATNAPVGIFLTDVQGKYVSINEGWETITGLSSQMAAGKGWTESVHPEDRERVVNSWDACAERGIGFTADYRILTPDGHDRWVYASAVPHRDVQGALRGLIGTLMDISERKLAEETLRVSTERYARAQRIGHIGDWEWELGMPKAYWSEEAYRLIGYSPDRD
jgi:PAS domain S-box-containing protein